MRPEIRAGEILAEMKKRGERETLAATEIEKSSFRPERVKLADFGVTEIRSHRWQKLAALPSAAPIA